MLAKQLIIIFLIIWCALLQGACLSKVNAQVEQKRIYIAADDHTDYFWKGDDETYRQAFLEMIDYYLDLADETQNDPSDFQSRWNCDGSYWIWTYEKNRSKAQFDRLMERVKDGHISFPLNALVVSQGGVPAEAVLRGMYYAGRLERQYDFRVPIAISMENQTLPYGLGSLWAGSGAKFSWKGICGCDTRIPDAWDRENEIYWLKGPDSSRVLMKWNSMLQGNQSIGGYAEARNPDQIVDYVDSDLQFRARYPYSVIGAFGKGWDDLKTLTREFVDTAKNKSNVNRRVIVSNEQDFFEDFETSYGAGLPSVAVSYGNEWDLYCAALAEVSARVKRSVEKLRAAEAMAALASLKDSAFMSGRETDRDRAWMNIGLFWEHNFGMSNPPTGANGVEKRIAWQKRLASEIENYVDALHSDAMTALGTMIEGEGDGDIRFFAFNPLSWSRTDSAELPYSGSASVRVIDLATGDETPFQIVTVSGERRLQILTEDVPSVGYKVYAIRPGAGQAFTNAASVNGNVLENDRYKITVSDRGAITSLIDKLRNNRELVRVINGRALNDLGAGAGTLRVENEGPVSVTLVAESNSPLVHTSRITLKRGQDRIEITNEIKQNFSATYTWGFGFNLDSPDVWHEEVGAVIRARLLTEGGHYSPRNARYDWLTLNHFADISETASPYGVTLSNADCYFMKLGNSTTDFLDTDTPFISVLAGGRVVNGDKGLPNQGGDTYFRQRFALQARDAYDPANAMRFALEHQNPVVTGIVSGESALLPENRFSAVTISDPSILLWSLKPADDGIDKGVVARLWNLLDRTQSTAFTVPEGSIRGAQQVTHIETPINSIPVLDGELTMAFEAQQIKSFLIQIDTLNSERGDDDGSGNDGGGDSSDGSGADGGGANNGGSIGSGGGGGGCFVSIAN